MLFLCWASFADGSQTLRQLWYLVYWVRYAPLCECCVFVSSRDRRSKGPMILWRKHRFVDRNILVFANLCFFITSRRSCFSIPLAVHENNSWMQKFTISCIYLYIFRIFYLSKEIVGHGLHLVGYDGIYATYMCVHWKILIPLICIACIVV